MRGEPIAFVFAVCAALLLQGCSRKEDGSTATPSPTASSLPPLKIEKLTLLPPRETLVRAEVPVTFRLESTPPLPADYSTSWSFALSGQPAFVQSGRGSSHSAAFPAGGLFKVQASAGGVVSNAVEVPVYRVALADAEGRPLREGRLALLSRDAFDSRGRLRDEALASSSDRVRILVEDPASGAPPSVTVASLTLPLSGPAERRVTRLFLLLGDREDAAAAGEAALPAAPGGRLEFRYREGSAGGVKVGPAVVHEIPIRFVAVGSGMPQNPEIERAADLRLAQANAVWEPFGRRFTRDPIVRLDQFRGLFLIRGRAAGADSQGRPSRSGVVIDGREVSTPAIWRNDGAPMTPKATARALIEKAGKSFQIDLFESLFAGDREALVLRVRRRDGTPAIVERIADGSDVAQAVTPLPSEAREGIEAAPSANLLSLEEIALLASGKGAPSQGFDVFIVTGIRSLQARPAFKVYPNGLFPSSMAGSAIVSWTILDGTGRYPYGLARVAGEMLMPPGVRPAPEDTLFAEPLSEAPGIDAQKRVTAATGLKIAERGRGLAAKK